MKEIKESDVDEQELHWMIQERAREIYWEWDEPLLNAVYRGDFDAAFDKGLEKVDIQLFEELFEKVLAEAMREPEPDDSGEILPWERQPEEPAQRSPGSPAIGPGKSAPPHSKPTSPASPSPATFFNISSCRTKPMNCMSMACSKPIEPSKRPKSAVWTAHQPACSSLF